MKKLKEWFRKRMVSLKRNPNQIPLLMLVISCLVFNLNLTSYSDTIALINEPGMGICSFVITLCSFLTIITFLGAFPRRRKAKIGSIIIVCAMLLLSIYCQIQFNYFIKYGTEIKDNPIEITAARQYITTAKSISIVHIILLAIDFIIICLLPVYRKLLNKIDTSVKVEDISIKDDEMIIAQEE